MNQADDRAFSPLAADVESLLLIATEPLSVDALALTTQADVDEVYATLTALADFYNRSGRGFRLRPIAGGWQLATRPEQAEVVARWVVEGQSNRLSQAALETLAVIAYSQPTSRSRVSAVRGVNVDGVVRTLLARGLVTESGRDESTGAGLLKTTDYFLECLGLGSLGELPPIAPLLPQASELEAELSRLATPADPTKENDG